MIVFRRTAKCSKLRCEDAFIGLSTNRGITGIELGTNKEFKADAINQLRLQYIM